MKYLVKVLFTNVAHVEVRANSSEEAQNIVNSSFGVIMGAVSVNVDEKVIPDWNLPMHPQKSIEWVRVDQ